MAAQRGDAGTPCPQCGSPLAFNSRFCGGCGHMMSTRQIHPDPHNPTQAQPTGAAAVSQPVVPDRIQLAGRGVRCTSFLLDIGAMVSPALPLSIAGAALGVAEVVYLVVPVAFAAVWAWMQVWQGLTGNSFGKAMLGLRVVRAADNRPPGVAATVLRSGIFQITLGLAAIPVVVDSTPRQGLHDRVSGLTVLDVTTGANPLGQRQQAVLRRSADRTINRVHSPIPVAAPRRG